MTYSISKHIGDIIFSLAFLKYVKADKLVLFDDGGGFMTESMFNQLAPLLEKQSYIGSFCHCPFSFHSPMNGFRHWLKWFSVPESCFFAYGYSRETALKFIRENDWLINVDQKPIKKILVNRTHRYFSEDFSHNLSLFNKDDIGFIGLEYEYERFVKNTGLKIDFIPTKDFLEVAQVIKGSDLLIGETSSSHAMAQAMSKPCISFCRSRNWVSVDLKKLSYLLIAHPKIDKLWLLSFLSENNIDFDLDVLANDPRF